MTETLQPPQAGKILIKTFSSTINPFDRVHYHTIKTEGNTLGRDGCGVIEQVGAGVDSALVGQKAIFFKDAWSTYAEKDPNEVIFLDKKTDLSTVSNGYVNPLTAIALLDTIESYKATAFI